MYSTHTHIHSVCACTHVAICMYVFLKTFNKQQRANVFINVFMVGQ